MHLFCLPQLRIVWSISFQEPLAHWGPKNGPEKFVESSITQPQIVAFCCNLVHGCTVGPQRLQNCNTLLVQDGGRLPNFQSLNSYNSGTH